MTENEKFALVIGVAREVFDELGKRFSGDDHAWAFVEAMTMKVPIAVEPSIVRAHIIDLYHRN
jgi:hypothetical protein